MSTFSEGLSDEQYENTFIVNKKNSGMVLNAEHKNDQ